MYGILSGELGSNSLVAVFDPPRHPSQLAMTNNLMWQVPVIEKLWPLLRLRLSADSQPEWSAPRAQEGAQNGHRSC